jgi:hypothetical protein
VRHAIRKQFYARLRPYLPFGRVIVAIAVAVGVATLTRQLLAQDEDLYPAFLKALAAAFAVMVALGTGREFWRNKPVASAQGPAGTGGLGFGDESKATQQAVDDLNTRVTTQMEDVNKRLFDLESAVFKPDDSGDDGGE